MTEKLLKNLNELAHKIAETEKTLKDVQDLGRWDSGCFYVMGTLAGGQKKVKIPNAILQNVLENVQTEIQRELQTLQTQFEQS